MGGFEIMNSIQTLVTDTDKSATINIYVDDNLVQSKECNVVDYKLSYGRLKITLDNGKIYYDVGWEADEVRFEVVTSVASTSNTIQLYFRAQDIECVFEEFHTFEIIFGV